MNLASKIETLLREKQHPLFDGLVERDEFIWPAYDGHSLLNVPATLFSMLGCDASMLAPPLSAELWAGLETGVKRVVLVLLDAVGFVRLRRQIESGQLSFLRRAAELGRFAPLTSIFPSTTTAALTSLHTGRAPAAHGMLAYILYLKQYAMLVEMIRLKPFYGQGDLTAWGFEPENFVPVPGIGKFLAEQDVLAAHFIYGAFINSPLSRIFYRDYHTLSAIYSSADMFVQMRRFLEDHPAERVLLSGYWGSVDTIAHMRGPTHSSWGAEVENLVWALEHHFWRPLPPALRDGTLLVLLADHGQVSVDYEQALIVREQPPLDDGLLLPPAGESRAAFLYPRAGRLAEVESFLRREFSENFATVRSAEALDAGLFGPPPWAEETAGRIGDLLLLARGSAVIEWERSEKGARILGRHGGLTAAEMLIPYLAVRLDAL